MTAIGSLVAAGRTSDVYVYGDGSVVKVPRPDVPSHWAALEAEFTTAVRRLGAPAPEVRGMVRIEGRDAIVFERVWGESMWQKMLDTPADLPALGRELATVHRAIMSSGLPVGLADSVDRMCVKLSEVDALSEPDRTEARQLARSLPRGAVLLHGDLHPGNVLLGASGPVVIDWFDAAIGHPISDVIRTSLLIRRDGGTSLPLHLPGASPQVLSRLLEIYIGEMIDFLAADDEVLQRWESLIAACRLAEGAEPDTSTLLALWEGRHGGSTSPLLDVVSAVSAEDRVVADRHPE